MPDDPDPPFCGCGSSEQVQWGAAFSKWLCVTCRAQAVNNMLDTTVTAIPVVP